MWSFIVGIFISIAENYNIELYYVLLLYVIDLIFYKKNTTYYL